MTMKTIVKITVAAALLLTAPLSAFAEEFTKGTVKKVDAAAKKVTIIHEELKNLDMPAMTMVFRLLTVWLPLLGAGWEGEEFGAFDVSHASSRVICSLSASAYRVRVESLGSRWGFRSRLQMALLPMPMRRAMVA